MAKGDKKKLENQLNTQTAESQAKIDELSKQNQALTSQFQSQYQPAVQQNQQNYSDVMGQYNQFLQNQGNSGQQLNQFLGPQYSSPKSTGQGQNVEESFNQMFPGETLSHHMLVAKEKE